MNMEEQNTPVENNKILKLFNMPLFRVICLAVLIVLVIIAAATVISGHVKKDTAATNVSSDDFFYPIGTDNVLDMQNYADGIAVLQTNSVSYLDKGGNLIAENSHKYSNPVLRTAGKYTFLFDRGANVYRIESKSQAGNDIVLDSPIINADICATGTFGYLLNADAGYQSHFFVYSAKNEKLFEWGSASDYATLIKLSDNGKRAVVVTFGVENAEPFSKVFYFDFSDEKEIFSAKLRNTTVFAVKYISGNYIAVYADNGVYMIKKDGSYNCVRSYSSTELNCASVHTFKISAISLNQYGNEQSVQTVLFDQRLKKQAECQLDEKVSFIYADDKYAALVCGNTIKILDLKGTIRTIPLEETCTKCVLRNNTVYALTPGGIVARSVFSGESSKY